MELDLARELAQAQGIPFESRSVDVARTGNLLAAARSARYAALEAFADEVGPIALPSLTRRATR